MTDQPPHLVQLGDAQTEVVGALFDSLPREGWTNCTVEYRSTVSMAESKARASEPTSLLPGTRAGW